MHLPGRAVLVIPNHYIAPQSDTVPDMGATVTIAHRVFSNQFVAVIAHATLALAER